ncbi:ABC transporter permease [Pseudoclavibacter chungangensis]|uniref:ABC transporter permease n=2 Tax=Pseudoclavibacter chungangensis TaxID=587635 RepID=A0A7J5C1W7_9MICO|nr:ABC transporter permease [Pseudoclavibacter chungangensis]
MTGIGLIARREILVALRSKAFLISYFIVLVFVAGGIVALSIIGGNQSDAAPPSVAATSETATAASDAGLDVVSTGTVEQAIDSVRDGTVESAVLPASALGQIQVYSNDGTPVTATSAGDGDALVVIGLDEPSDAVVSALTVVPDGYSLVQPTVAPWLGYLLSIAFGVMFMMSAITYCSTIAQSVVEEKQTRIVEILLATVTPRTIMAGKIIGNSALALGQVASIVVVALITLSLTGQGMLFGLMGPAFIWFGVLFIVGFVLLASLYAGVAATVSRQEDVAAATMPLMFVIMIPYMLAIFANDNPVVMSIMSYVPFSAPIAMPARVATGAAEWWEPFIALVVLVVSAVIGILVGARLYENSVLRTGKRVKLSEALKG